MKKTVSMLLATLAAAALLTACGKKPEAPAAAAPAAAQAIVIGLLLFPIYALATHVGSRYFSAGGSQHYRRAALAILAMIGLSTLAIATWDYAVR